MRSRRDEINVCLHSKAGRGKDAVAAQGVIARKSRGFEKPQPFFNAARFRAVTVVIENALSPRLAKRWIFAARENGCVFDGNAALIKIAIECPSLKLAARELALMHQQVKRMF